MIPASMHAGTLLHALKELIPGSIRRYYWTTEARLIRNPWLWVSVAAIFALEKFAPADRRQRLWSRATLEDFCWFWLSAAFVMVALPPIAGAEYRLYTAITAGHGVIAATAAWPLGARIALSVVIGDFVVYAHHWVRHRRAFWPFHAIHHAQRELNQFTDLRFHFVDVLVGNAIFVVPAAALDLAPDTFIAIVVVRAAYGRLIHSNVRTNFGPLRHILVSPQFHRIHHSMLPEHQDRNFGAIFTCWDRLFGTMHRGYDDYPETGLSDVDFGASDGTAVPVPVRIARELAYPFRELASQAAAILSRRSAPERPPAG